MIEAIAAVTREANAPFTIEPVSVADPGPGQVRVRVEAVGICHTDLVCATGALGAVFPIVLGHEGAGTVESVGLGVGKVAPGDKVIMTFASCGKCGPCHDHDPAYCASFTTLNFPGVGADGRTSLSQYGKAISGRYFGQSSFASYAIAEERNIVKVPAHLDLALLAPLGCSVQTGAGAVMRSLEAKAGSTLIVVGGGAVGLSAVLGGVLSGCGTIILVEPQQDRRAVALEIGATHAIDPAAGPLAEAVRGIAPGGANYIVDTTGNVAVLQEAVGLLAQKGKLGMIGVPGALDAAVQMPIVPALTVGYSIQGICEGDSDPDTYLPELIEYLEAGRLPVEKFITVYPFDQINEAIKDAHGSKCVKVVLTF
ncbi:NAD(P)-dependent alcohol dehydrogenase [Novosphingobium sp. BL-52-GroH]|uniref:NAD(P)-dependent alcohol dehydrogenase n=1 Tax=Novosphingobium sp. BL-52-GroH TaxID=3349877 RepID=UPI00384F17F5